MSTFSVIADICNQHMEFNVDHYFLRILHISYSYGITPVLLACSDVKYFWVVHITKILFITFFLP